jgi:hypothetical protein
MDWIGQALDLTTLLVGVGFGYLLGRRSYFPITGVTYTTTSTDVNVAQGIDRRCQCGVPGVRCPVHNKK